MILSRILGHGRETARSGGLTKVQSIARTHVGRVRKINEDRVLDRPDLNLWAVADGMGGHNSGDVAAQIAVDTLGALAGLDRGLSADDVMSALQAANAEICHRYQSDDQRSGTTVVAALLNGDTLDIFWAGDSRAYCIRKGSLQLLTRDHSLVQQMVDAGALSSSAAARHPKSNVITRALGVGIDLIIDRSTTTVLSGDQILLCSDGISRTLGHKLPKAGSINALAQSILDDALTLDGSDNASVVFIAVS